MNCGACDSKLQALRNCSGTGSPARILLNDSMYTRCPRAVYMESLDARYFIKVYMEYRNHGTWPAPGGFTEQTSFCINLFEFIEELFAKNEAKAQKRAHAAQKKQAAQAKKSRG